MNRATVIFAALLYGTLAAEYAMDLRPEFWPYDGATKPQGHQTDYSISQMMGLIRQTAEQGCIFFWSGRYSWAGVDNYSIEPRAEKVATRLGCRTLEMTLKEVTDLHAFAMPDFSVRGPASELVWVKASEAFAHGAHSEINIIFGQVLRDGNVWEKYEHPALTDPARTPPVTRIWRWEYNSFLPNGPVTPTLYDHPPDDIQHVPVFDPAKPTDGGPDSPIRKRSLNEVWAKLKYIDRFAYEPDRPRWKRYSCRKE
jgi:hypothetical protein